MALKPMVIYVDDGSGLGSGLPVDPGYGVPAPGPRPGHDLPGRPPGSVDNTLPPIPVHKPAPGGGHPAVLPVLPQGAFIVVWAPGQGWIAVPVNAHPDQSLPGGPPDHASGQPVPPGRPSTQPTPPQPTPTPQGRR